MNIRKYILLVIAIVLFVGCNSDKDEGGKRNDKVKVYITASHDLATRSSFEDEVIVVDTEPAQSTNTRTELGPVENETTLGDEQKIYWSEDDSFVMWAAPTGTTTYNLGFNAKVFERDTYNYDFNTADFVTELGRVMDASQKYDYYAAYTVPNDPNFGAHGTSVTYNLKTTQSGDYDPAMDVMYATITNANALVPRDPKQAATNDRVWDEPELHFSHMLHTLRIWVPAGKNLMDKPIKRLDIVFPGDVVGGTLSFSAANPTQPTWKGQSDRVTIEFADGDLLNAEGRYVWVYIKPENLSGQMTFRAYDQNGVPSKAITTTLSNHNFQAQHITPIKLTIPQKLEPVRVEFSCPDSPSYPNFLGETATEMVVKSWPAGIAAAATKLSATDGKFTADFYYDGGNIPVNPELAGATMSAGFKSASADVSDIAYTITLPNMSSSREAHYALPYLFFEDFASVGDISSNDEFKTSSTGSKGAVSFLSGWTGGRIGAQAGKAIRIACRRETSANYEARVDSAPISNMKSGVSSTVGIYFNYGMDRYEMELYWFEYREANFDLYQTLWLKYVNDTKAYESGDTDGPDVHSFTIDTEGHSYDNIPLECKYSMDGCLNTTRITWQTLNEYMAGTSNGTYWLYIDNIKVSIGGTAKHTDNKNYRSFFPNHKN